MVLQMDKPRPTPLGFVVKNDSKQVFAVVFRDARTIVGH